MLKRPRHSVSPELRNAVIEYYSQMGQDKIESMRLIEYKWGHSMHDDILVRFTDENKNAVTTICTYDGHDGKLYNVDRPVVTEFTHCYRTSRTDEEDFVNCYTAEKEDDYYDYCGDYGEYDSND